jgi:hypothetical protein
MAFKSSINRITKKKSKHLPFAKTSWRKDRKKNGG